MKTRAELAEAVATLTNQYVRSRTVGILRELENAVEDWSNAPPDPSATPTLNWRPHTEVPDPEDGSKAHLIAERNSNGGWFLVAGLFYCASHKGEPPRWYPENDWKEYKPDSRFFWLPESELLATLSEIKK
jgi:hypothetical protein